MSNEKIVEYTKKTYLFDRVRTHIRKIFDENILEDKNLPSLDFHIEDALTQLTVSFWIDRVGKTQTNEFKFYIPATWWQYFKKQYRHKRFMRWLVKRKPVKSKRLLFDLRKITVFPEVEVPTTPDFKNQFSFLEMIRKEKTETEKLIDDIKEIGKKKNDEA